MVFGFLRKNKSLDNMSASDMEKLSSKEFAKIFYDEFNKCHTVPQSEIPLIFKKLSHLTMAWMKKDVGDANCLYAICIIGNDEWESKQLEALYMQAEFQPAGDPSLKTWFKETASQSIEARKRM